MNSHKHVELQELIEKTVYHQEKAYRGTQAIIEYLKSIGYINEELIKNVVNEIITNSKDVRSPEEYMSELFKNLNVEGNF